MNTCPTHFKPKLWVLYVDDIFIIFEFQEEAFQELLLFVNSFIQSIQFTYEKESDHKLSFLDVLVFHNPNTLGFEFTVYRKPTNAESYIHFFSYHSLQIKSNIIVNMARRAFRICDPNSLTLN